MAYESEHPLINTGDNNSIIKANSITNGSQMIGSLALIDDVDYYKVYADGPSLITLAFTPNIATDANHWTISLLDSAGSDYLFSPFQPYVVSPHVNGANQADNTLDVTGLSSTPQAGSRFTIATASADTLIYTVLSSTAVTDSGTATLTLDKAVTNPANNADLVFEPASTSTGSETALSALVNSAGYFYAKVNGVAGQWSDDQYGVTVTVTPTEEKEDNNTRDNALDSGGNRMLQDVPMTGHLSSVSDTDVWFFTPVSSSLITFNFAAATGETNEADWAITITDWEGNAVQASSNKLFALQAGTAVTDSFYGIANTTYLVTVSNANTVTPNSDAYTVKVSGADVDLNDRPLITVGTITTLSTTSYLSPEVVGARNIQKGEAVLLSSLFSASDADTSQTLIYSVTLDKPEASQSTGYLKVDDTSYGFGTVQLSAEQLKTAQFFAGNATGELTLGVQVHDNSGAKDGSADSALVEQTLKTVEQLVSVTTTNVVLEEGKSSSNATVNVTLLSKPATGETVTVSLQHGSETPSAYQLAYTTTEGNPQYLEFTSANWNVPQAITVKAVSDNVSEASQTGVLSFRVASSKADSAYIDLLVASRIYTITDAANHPPVGVVSLAGDFKQGAPITASNTIQDDDGIQGGSISISYEWKISSDKVTWSEIEGSGSSSTYTPTNSDAGNYIRAEAIYTDGQNKVEKVASASSATVIANTNDAPTVAHSLADQSLVAGSVFSYVLPGNTFNDIDASDTLTYTAQQVTDEAGQTVATGTLALGDNGWLGFNAQTLTFSASTVATSGTTAGHAYIKVTATDPKGLSVSDVFTLTVTEVPGAPKVAVLLADQNAAQGTAFSYTIPAGAFTDKDVSGQNDTSAALEYSAVQAQSGAPLPAWLTFNPTTKTFSGTPTNSDFGTTSVKVTATDGTYSALDLFDITIANVAPTLATPATVTFTDTVAADTVASLTTSAVNRTGTLVGQDIDSGTLTYSIAGVIENSGAYIKNGTYATLQVIKATGAYTLTPNAEAINKLGYNTSETFTVAVTDGSLTTSKTLSVNILGVDDTSANDNPKLTQISTLTGAQAQKAFEISYEMLAGNADAADRDAGQTLSFRIETVPNELTLTKNGTPVITGQGVTLGVGEKLVWTPAVQGGALDVFTVKAVDSAGGVSEQAVHVKVDVGAALPSSTNDSVTTLEDNNYVFTINDFGTYNDNDTTQIKDVTRVQITTLESAGALKYSSDGSVWSDVALNQIISTADIAAGKLHFDPVQDANGSPYATFGFKVGHADALSSDAYTVTVNVTAVNDAPTTTGDLQFNANEEGVNADGSAQAAVNPSGAASALMTHIADVDSTLFSISNAKENSAGSFAAVTAGSTSASNGLSVNGNYGTLVVGADGSYAYTVDQSKPVFNTLGENDFRTDEFTVKVSDGDKTVDQVLNIVIDGTDDVSGFDLSGTVKFWNGASPMSGVDLEIPGILGKATTDAAGEFSRAALAIGNHQLNFAKAATGDNSASAINAIDVRLAVKIALNISPNADGSSATQYQYYAADVTKDGVVNAIDVRNLVKMALNLDDALPKEWIFAPKSIEADHTFTDIHIPWVSIMNHVVSSENLNVEMIGVFMGDIDGNCIA